MAENEKSFVISGNLRYLELSELTGVLLTGDKDGTT